MRLIDKYQPRTWSDIIGQEKAIAKIRRIVERPGFSGDAFWLTGNSGVGKTSTAKVLADQFAEPWNIFELDGEVCTVDAVRAAIAQATS